VGEGALWPLTGTTLPRGAGLVSSPPPQPDLAAVVGGPESGKAAVDDSRLDVAIRQATVGDADFLLRMVAKAGAWRPGAVERTPTDILATPELARYVVGWPRPGDRGVIAEVGEPIGAAWYRLFSVAEHGYGFVAPDIPELCIAVVQGWRGRGVGRRLMGGLIRLAAEEGVHAVSLSVESDNPASHLYRSLGFREVGRVGGALTMVALVPEPARP
jgi:ribosomal protein S18 acetylase RimI-like enzyme